MTSTTHTIRRLMGALVLAVALAAFAAAVAFGDNPSDRPGRGAPNSQVVAPDWFERAAARAAIADGDRRSPDTIDAALEAQSRRSSATQLDLRPPDTRDAALRAHQVAGIQGGDSGRATVQRSPDWFERAAAAAIRNDRVIVVDDRFRLDPTTAPSPVTATSSGREIEWPQLAIGFGLGILLGVGLFLALRMTRVRTFAR